MQRAELRDGEAAAAASYRVLSRLLGYGAGPEAGAAGGPGSGAAVAGPPGPGGARLPLPVPAPGGAPRPPPQLMVFRNAAEGRPGEEEAAAGGGEGPAGGPELLCPRHRCALEPKAAAGGGWGPPGGLELQLAALGLRPPALGAKGPAACPCLGPPAAEETSDALLVLEALEPDEAESCSEEEPGSPGPADPQEPPRGAAAAAARRAVPGPGAAGGRKGSLRVRLSRLFRTKSCSGGSAPGDGGGGSRRGAELTASAHSLSDGGGARGRGQEEGRYGAGGGTRGSELLGGEWGGCAGGAVQEGPWSPGAVPGEWLLGVRVPLLRLRGVPWGWQLGMLEVLIPQLCAVLGVLLGSVASAARSAPSLQVDGTLGSLWGAPGLWHSSGPGGL